MNQQFRVLQELGEHFESAIEAALPDDARRRSTPGNPSIRRIARAAPGAVAIAFAIGGALAVALVALLLVGPAHHGPKPSAAANNEASLVAQYAVLRRPQISADRINAGPAPGLGRGSTSFGAGSGPTPGHETRYYKVHITGLARYHDVPSLTRVVTVGGVHVSLFVERLVPSYTLPKATVRGNDPKGAARSITPAQLKMVERRANAGAGYYLVARVGRSGRARVIAGPAGARARAKDRRVESELAGLQGVSTASLRGSGGKIVAVVPDGVTRLMWIWPREFDSQRLTFVPRVTLSATVQDNVAAAAAPTRFTDAEQIGPETVIRYAADGSVLARLTDQSNSASVYQNTTYSGGVPGPETAQSQRAEGNPATPNRIVIVPDVVTLRSIRFGPGPSFFFTVLLNHRHYFMRVTGGPRPSCIKPNPRYSGGSGNGAVLTTFAQPTVRGDTFSGGLGGSINISCRGVYRLAISILNSQNKPYSPFGSATFSVH